MSRESGLVKEPLAGYRTAGQVAWRRIGDETVVLHLSGKRAFGLNPVAGLVWELLVKGAARNQLESVVDSSRSASLEAFLADLAVEGLVEETDAAPATGTLHADPGGRLDGEPSISWREEIASVIQLSCGAYPTQCGDHSET